MFVFSMVDAVDHEHTSNEDSAIFEEEGREGRNQHHRL
jgi:hypothetical protein